MLQMWLWAKCVSQIEKCLPVTVGSKQKRTRRAERTDPCCGSSVLCHCCVTEWAICPWLTLTKVQHSPLGPHTHNHPSLALICYQAAALSVCVHVCGSVCLFVWGPFEWSCCGPVTLIAISTVTPGWWTAEQQAHCFSECVFTRGRVC